VRLGCRRKPHPGFIWYTLCCADIPFIRFPVFFHPKFHFTTELKLTMTSMHRLALRTAAAFLRLDSQFHGMHSITFMSSSASSQQVTLQTQRITMKRTIFFRFSGLEHSFAIDPDMLKQSYRKLMIDFHPDKALHSKISRQPLKKHQGHAGLRYFKHLHTRASHLLKYSTSHGRSGEGDLVGMVF
jgi:hypothetical protein